MFRPKKNITPLQDHLNGQNNSIFQDIMLNNPFIEEKNSIETPENVILHEPKQSILEASANVPKDAILFFSKTSSPMVRVDDPTFSLIDSSIPLYKEKKGGRGGKIFFIQNNQRIYVQRKDIAKRKNIFNNLNLVNLEDVPEDAILFSTAHKMVRIGDPTLSPIDSNIPLYKEKGSSRGKVFFLQNNQRIYVQRKENAKENINKPLNSGLENAILTEYHPPLINNIPLDSSLVESNPDSFFSETQRYENP